MNMSFVYYTSLVEFYYSLGFIVFLINLIVSFILLNLTKIKIWASKKFNDQIYNVIRFFLILSIIFNFIILFILFYYYLLLLKDNFANISFNIDLRYLYSSINLTYFFFKNFSLDLVGLVMALLAYLVGILSFFALDSRFYHKNHRFVLMCNLLCLTIIIFTSTNNVLTLFFSYEMLLIPSFLFVYYISPYKRSIQASVYFLIWTQIGSLFVLMAVVYLFTITGSYILIDIQNHNFTSFEMNVIFYLLFFGFGIKVPIWPFHHWLTKTHVEAPAGFSMFLSGFLVKSALYGFYKLSFNLGGEVSTIIATIFVIIGSIDASLKMWSLTDLKKLVAFATIQEMNLIFLLFCFGDSIALWGGVLFCITHALLSSLLFYTVDCVQRRYHTRSIVELSGVLMTTPNLGIVIFFNTLLYSGLPGTLKFTSEIYLYLGLFEHSSTSLILIIFGVNFLGLIGFSKSWYNILFGLNKPSTIAPVDLTYKDVFIILFTYIGLIGFNYLAMLILI